MPQGNGIRRAKDLRARFSKFLILTNERKKMSKTTLRKRISLVAVTALTAGVLSVVVAPAASANIAAGTITSQATFTADSLNVAVIPTTTGAAVSNGTTANSNLSLGVIYKDASSTTAQSATMLGSGALALYTLGTTVTSVTASGGTFSSATTSGASTQIAITANLRGVLTTATATNVAVVWTPGAVGTYTISMYRTELASGTAPSASLGLARGTLVSQITVTAVASGAAGSYSAAYSLCNLGATATTASATNSDASGAGSKNNGATGFINFKLNDTYGTQLAAGLPLVATVTGNAILDIATTASGAVSTSDVDATVTAGTISVVQSVANAPAVATVTLSYNGTTVCTKTITFAGEVASIKAVAVRAQIGTSGATQIVSEPLNGLGGGTIRVEAFDSSGAKVNPLTAGGTAAVHTQFGAVASTLNATVTGITFYSGAVATGTASTDASGLWPLAFTQASHTCSSTQGVNDKLQVTFQNPSGTIITSPAFSARCANTAVTYSASWDKASYVQGDIAKLTVQFKDVKGNNAPSSGVATVGTVTGTTPTITAPMMTLVGTLTNNAAVDINGAVVYTYTVGTSGTFTEGSYQSIVDFALSGTTGSVQTAAYKVATSGTPGVTNADVLKSIVALIASINKQIQALQKLILKR